MQVLDFNHRADLPPHFISKDYILSQDNIMLNNMHGHIIDPHIGIRMFHTVAVFFNKPKSTLYCCAKRLQFFVDNGIWSSWPVSTVAISKMCIRDKSTSVSMFFAFEPKR